MHPRRPPWTLTRLALLLLTLLFLPGAANLGLNGQLLVSSALAFDPAEVRRMQRIEPKTEVILGTVRFEAITYWSDGLRIHGYVARPNQGSNLPCVIYNRGGNRAFGALTDMEAVLSLGPIAQAGYVVVASQYRGFDGGIGKDEFGGADVNDVLNLIPLLDELPQADPSRIGMVGWSRGGMMTYLALARTDRIDAAVIGAGEANLIEAARSRPDLEQVFRELIPNYPEHGDVELAARSATSWPERLHKETPILVMHGGADWRVNPMQALQIAEKLYQANHPFRLVFFEGGDHGLTQYRGEVQSLMLDWLDRYVRLGTHWPSLEPNGR